MSHVVASYISRKKKFLEKRVDLETNKLSKNVDPYACAIRTKNQYPNSWKTVGHIPREISRRVDYFIKAEGVFVNG